MPMDKERPAPDFEVTGPNRSAKPSEKKKSSEELARFVTTPQALGWRLLERHQDRILIVEPGTKGFSGWRGGGGRLWGESVAYVLRPNGLWDPTPDHWRDMVVQELHEMEHGARMSLDGQAILQALRAIHAAQRNRGLVEAVRLNLSATAKLDPERFGELTRCTADELDADLRYLGCDNGVVDVHTGELLSPEEGRKHLMTRTTGVPFDPDATHADVDRLFGHLEPEVREWYWKVMAYSLFGRPSRRIYLIVGEKGGGKSAMVQAYVGTLGEYAEEPMDSALTESSGSGQHNTELAAFASPTRVCIMDDVNLPSRRASAALLKRLSGDGHFTFRRLRENPQTRRATATLLIVANPGKLPRLHLEDEAMVDRIRELPYPSVPERKRDPGLMDRIRTMEFKIAFLAQLVKRAAKMNRGHPPQSIPTVRQATAERVAEDLGEFGAFARRLRPAAGERLLVNEVWAAWCVELGVVSEEKEARERNEAGGVKRRALTRRLGSLIPSLPKTMSIRGNDGKVVRGWKDWKLVDGDEGSI